MVIVSEYGSRKIFITFATDENEDNFRIMDYWVCFGELDVRYFYVQIFLWPTSSLVVFSLVVFLEDWLLPQDILCKI